MAALKIILLGKLLRKRLAVKYVVPRSAVQAFGQQREPNALLQTEVIRDPKCLASDTTKQYSALAITSKLLSRAAPWKYDGPLSMGFVHVSDCKNKMQSMEK